MEALAYLKKPNILDQVVKDIDELGYVGEGKNKKLGYLITISRKLNDPLSGIIISSSSAGKSGLVETLEKLVPQNDLVSLSNLTPQALYYMQKDYLKHKLLIIEERKGSELSDYSIRILQSKKKLTHATALRDKLTGEIQTKLIQVEGPVSILETTTNNSINPENASRVFELYLDEGQEQTKRIQEFQKRTKTLEWLGSENKHKRITKKHHAIQNLLQPVRIINPFVDKIQFPAHMVRTRRDHLRFLNLIEVITFLYQHQRERKVYKGTEYIESTTEDYEIAHELMKDIMNHSLDILSKTSRELYHHIESIADNNGKSHFTKQDISRINNWPVYRIRDNIKELIDYGYVEVVKNGRGSLARYKIGSNGDNGDWLKNFNLVEESCSSST